MSHQGGAYVLEAPGHQGGAYVLEPPGHRGGGRVGAAGARRHALLQVTGQRRMYLLEPADDVADPGGDRLAGTFGLVAEQAGRAARGRRGSADD